MDQYKLTIAVLLLFLFCSFCSAEFVPDYEDDNTLPLGPHERVRRHLKFISRKPGPDSVPEMGIGFKGHVMNLLKGGTLGVMFSIPHVDRLGKKFPNWEEVVFGDKGGKDSKGPEVESRENEVDYTHINPRVKKDQFIRQVWNP